MTHTILIIEDDRSLQYSISLALEMAGYRTISASSLQAAEDLSEQADLILLDVMLPDGSGIAFCRSFRERCTKPIIFLTSCTDETDIIRGLDSGGDDYITKPFRLQELLSRIRANLRRVPNVKDDLELTALEQNLLEYLMENRDRFLTRDQILAHLWDVKGKFVNDNTLSVNISRLREKLKDSNNGQIITKRGMGYKWTDGTN